jgi:ribosomal protein L7/L12
MSDSQYGLLCCTADGWRLAVPFDSVEDAGTYADKHNLDGYPVKADGAVVGCAYACDEITATVELTVEELAIRLARKYGSQTIPAIKELREQATIYLGLLEARDYIVAAQGRVQREAAAAQQVMEGADLSKPSDTDLAAVLFEQMGRADIPAIKELRGLGLSDARNLVWAARDRANGQ